MPTALKAKVTLSLDAVLVATVDQQVRAHVAASRSAAVEAALRCWQRERRQHAIEQGIEAYYRSCSVGEHREARAWSRLASRAARQLWND